MDKAIQKTGADVNGFVVYNKKVLILYRPEYSLWEVPHGKIELDEHPETTAKREILEETGLKVDYLELLSVDNWVYEKADSIKNMVSLTYIAQVNSDIITLENEHTAHKWVSLAELNQIPNISSAIRKLLHKINSSKYGFDNNVLSFSFFGKEFNNKLFVYVPEKNIVLTANEETFKKGITNEQNTFTLEFKKEDVDLPHWLKDILIKSKKTDLDDKKDPIDDIIDGKLKFLGQE